MKKDVKIYKKSKLKFFLQILMTFVIIFSLFAVSVVSADKAVRNTKTVFANDKVKIDFTEANENGIVKVNTVLGFEERIKVTVAKNEKDSMTYTYDLKNDTTAEAFPLQMGDGEYIVKVWRQVKGITYRLKFSAIYYVELTDQHAPFLSPNQYVNFNEDSKIVKIAEKLTKNCKTDVEKIEAIYKFVIDNLVYDDHKAATVQHDYLPAVDEIIDLGKGICFDYAAVLAAMLRSQGIPTKLVIGYIKDTNGGDDLYHAWNKFYLEEGEFTINALKLEDNNLVRVDPTFDSSSKSSKTFSLYINDNENYMKQKKY
jgi:transglutaminase-like putative cysteine protease